MSDSRLVTVIKHLIHLGEFETTHREPALRLICIRVCANTEVPRSDTNWRNQLVEEHSAISLGNVLPIIPHLFASQGHMQATSLFRGDSLVKELLNVPLW